MSAKDSDKLIVRNTVYLYIQTIVVLIVSLYTSRVILNTLGEVDYGIYNVVGGVITMFSFIGGSLTTASQRFITFELGKGENGNVNKIFSISLLVHLSFALVIVIIAEPIGIWFINNKLQIPPDRLVAAQWLFQFTIITMIFMFASVPYSALIVAHEKMTAFAIIAILDSFLKLGIAFSILFFNRDKLVLYGLLMCLEQVLIRIVYSVYCKRNFRELRFHFYFDKAILKEYGGFASWSLFGNAAVMTYTQGLNMLLGVFFSPVVNAARGVSVQVQGAINHFVNSFHTAINPQITKRYASGQTQDMLNLVFFSSRFSFYLLLIMSVPILLETDFVLRLWLGKVPAYSVTFLRIILLTTWINSLANPLIVTVKATGNVKKYESTIAVIMLLILPISYFFLRQGYPPHIVFVVHLFVECIAMVFRIIITRSLVHFSLRNYLNKVIVRVVIVALISIIIPLTFYLWFNQTDFRPFVTISSSIISSFVTIYFLGLSVDEKALLFSIFKKG